MAGKNAEVLRDVFVDSNNSLRISGTVSSGGISTQLETTQDLSVGELDYTTTETSDFSVNGAYFVFTGSTTQTITLTYNSVKIFEEEVTPNTSVFIDLAGQKIFASLGKQLNVKCTNAGTPAITVSLNLDIEVI